MNEIREALVREPTELLADDDLVGILLLAAKRAETNAEIQRAAIRDGLTDIEDVALWSEKQARAFRASAAALAALSPALPTDTDGIVERAFAAVARGVTRGFIQPYIARAVYMESRDCIGIPLADVVSAVEAAMAFQSATISRLTAERDEAREVVAAARNMPRRTPAAGGSSTVHQFQIEACHVWALDLALDRYDSALGGRSA